jgi:hypothetical protein
MSHSHLKFRRALLALAFGAVSCLPKDTRPPPASLLVTTSSDEAVRNGFDTDDGWHIEFTNFIISIGRSSLKGDACNSYSNASYVRVLDMQQAEPQKVSLIYGLGQCDFSFRLSHPGTTSLVGPGVSAEDVLYMQTDGADQYTSLFGTTNSGVVAIIGGIATRPDAQKIFSWSFRQNLQYSSCSVETDAGIESGLNLKGQESALLNILVRGEALFQTDIDPSRAQLLFGPMAMADSQFGNNDGVVMLDELGLVPIVVTGDSSSGGPFDAGIQQVLAGNNAGQYAARMDAGVMPLDASVGTSLTADGGAGGLLTLEDFVYLSLFPLIVRFQDTGQCATVDTPGGRSGLGG